MENSESIEYSLVGQPISDTVISPNNRILVASSGSNCEVMTEDRARRTLKHDSQVVSVIFQSNERLTTVTENGEVSEFEAKEKKFEKLVSRRVTAFPVVCAFGQKSKNDENDELELWLVVKKSDSDKEKMFDVCVIGANSSVEKVLEIPSNLKKEQISIGNGVVSYCDGLEVHSILLNDDDKSVVKSTKYTAKNGGDGDEEQQKHHFERIVTNGNYLVAAISDGRVLQWSNLKTAGVSDTHHRIHWHKVGAHVAITQFGNVLSAGSECVLARHAKGQKEPTLLPRLVAPVVGIALSQDSSTCALVMEDNSVHTVLLSTMAIKSSLPTLEYCPRSLNTVFCRDPLRPRNVVMNGKPGTLQWFDPVAAMTNQKMHVTLENAIDGDMTSRNIRSSFRDVFATSLTTTLIATIEKYVNFDGENHLRFWHRLEAVSTRLVASVAVARDVVFLATCSAPPTVSSRFHNTVISASTSGTISVWEYTEKDVREDLERSRNWQETEITAVSDIQADGKFATAHGQHAVLWNVKNMKIIDVLSCEDSIVKLSFTADGRHLIVATKKAVICWDVLCLLVVWRIQQSAGIVVNPIGCFAFSGPQVMRFEAETGRVLSTVQFSTPVDELLVIEQQAKQITYVAKTGKGILFHRPVLLRGGRKTRKLSDSETPFQQLSRVPNVSSAATPTSSDQQFVRQPRPEASRLFSGPVHNLPPISFIAPLYIEKALLPPPVRI